MGRPSRVPSKRCSRLVPTVSPVPSARSNDELIRYERMAKSRRQDAAQRVAVVLECLKADLRRQWSVRDMAAVIGVTDGRLRRVFLEGAGGTPRQALTNLRLEAAAQLLSEPGPRIKEIIDRVGLADASHFCRDFRHRFGMSPTEFRVQHTNLIQPDSANKSTIAPIDRRGGLT
jgi:AraC-like DNA-binding protein